MKKTSADSPSRPIIPWAKPPLTDRQKRRRIVIRGMLVGLIGVVAQLGSIFRSRKLPLVAAAGLLTAGAALGEPALTWFIPFF